VPAISYTEFRTLAAMPLIDVRSPAEYQHAHIPGALSLPLFSNDERAEVGTLYKQKGKDAAVLKGLEIIGPRLRETAENMKAIAGKNQQLGIYCWRGGMRSGAMAWLAETSGLQTWRLSGGYKAYRHQMLQMLSQPLPLQIIGGKTGSGKTKVLQALQQKGEQIIDLEALAHHKGSAFGHIGETDQPGNEQMENQMGECLLSMNVNHPIWVEDESKNIGSVFLNHAFFLQMTKAPLYILEIPFAQRVTHLMEIYGTLPATALLDSLQRIKKRLGPERFTRAEQSIQTGDIQTALEIVLEYYDNMYTFQLSLKKGRSISSHEANTWEEVIRQLPVQHAAEPR